jgi:hypothetical protein
MVSDASEGLLLEGGGHLWEVLASPPRRVATAPNHLLTPPDTHTDHTDNFPRVPLPRPLPFVRGSLGVFPLIFSRRPPASPCQRKRTRGQARHCQAKMMDHLQQQKITSDYRGKPLRVCMCLFPPLGPAWLV